MHTFLAVFAIITALIATSTVARAESPPNLTSDINWSAGTGGVADVEAAFDHGRRQEEIQLGLSVGVLGNLSLPSQSTWDTYSDDDKALYILNAERIARSGFPPAATGLPFQAIQVDVDNLAQTHAEYLVANNVFTHEDAANRTPFQRIDDDPVLGTCHEFLARAENLAAFMTSSNSNLLYIERAIYNWIYDDAGSLWGHREAALLQDKDLKNQNPLYGFNNNVGPATSEGFIGIGVAESPTYNPDGSAGMNWGTVVVLNMIDPKSDATCPWNDYTLTVNVIGSGSVSPSDGTYPENTAVELTATPAARWQFAGWSGALGGNLNPETVTMDADKTVVATFTEIPTPEYTLTVNVVGNGSVTPSSGTYPENTDVTLTATPADGWQFAGWGGALGSATDPETVSMDADKTVMATFTEIPTPEYTLTVNVVGNGSVTPSSGTYPENTDVTLTAIPADGWQFAGWGGALGGATDPETVSMDADKTVMATFTEIPTPEYTLTVNVVGNGSVTPSSGTYPEDTDVALTATPAAGWVFAGWTGALGGAADPETVTDGC